MSTNNSGQNGRPGAPQQQLSPPTDPRKRNVPSNNSLQTTQQRVKPSGSRQNDRYSTGMPMTASSSEHPTLYGCVPRALPVPPPPANVISLRDVLLMPPPPPPPRPIATTTAPPSFTAPPSVTPTFSCGHHAEKFDPTKPPPILRPQLNAQRKRGATDNIQAGPSSKIRQTELPDGPCTDCVQREIRSSIYQEQSVKLEQEHKVDETKYNNRFENVENGKLYLKSITTPRQYSLIENYVETGSTNNLFSEPNPSPLASFLQGTPVAPRHSLLDRLLEALIGGSRNSMLHLQPSTSREDSLLQLLSGGTRRSSVTTADPSLDMLGVLLEALRGSSTETAPTSSSPDRLHAMLDALRPAAESEQRVASERAGGSGNGLNRLANGGVPPGPVPAPVPAHPAPPAPRPARPYYAQTYPPPEPPSVPAPQPQPFYAPRYAAGAPQPPSMPPPVQHFAPPYYVTARPPPSDPRAPPPPNQYPQFGPSYPPYYPPGPPGPPY